MNNYFKNDTKNIDKIISEVKEEMKTIKSDFKKIIQLEINKYKSAFSKPSLSELKNILNELKEEYEDKILDLAKQVDHTGEKLLESNATINERLKIKKITSELEWLYNEIIQDIGEALGIDLEDEDLLDTIIEKSQEIAKIKSKWFQSLSRDKEYQAYEQRLRNIKEEIHSAIVADEETKNEENRNEIIEINNKYYEQITKLSLKIAEDKRLILQKLEEKHQERLNQISKQIETKENQYNEMKEALEKVSFIHFRKKKQLKETILNLKKELENLKNDKDNEFHNYITQNNQVNTDCNAMEINERKQIERVYPPNYCDTVKYTNDILSKHRINPSKEIILEILATMSKNNPIANKTQYTIGKLCTESKILEEKTYTEITKNLELLIKLGVISKINENKHVYYTLIDKTKYKENIALRDKALSTDFSEQRQIAYETILNNDNNEDLYKTLKGKIPNLTYYRFMQIILSLEEDRIYTKYEDNIFKSEII